MGIQIRHTAGDLESEEGFREGVAQHMQEDVENRWLPSVACYMISSESMGHHIFAAVLESVQSGLVSTASQQIMPELRGGETLGPGLAPARVSGQ